LQSIHSGAFPLRSLGLRSRQIPPRPVDPVDALPSSSFDREILSFPEIDVRVRRTSEMKFNSKLTSKALFTIVGGAVLINPVYAQDQDQSGEELDEVVVTGLRGSLKASLETKRDALGVVDSINAEDIGKFPDTNLAESLQRITGISIDRRNGEGAQVT